MRREKKREKKARKESEKRKLEKKEKRKREKEGINGECRYGFEGPVFVSPSKDNNPFTYDEEAHTLSYNDVSLLHYYY